MDRETKTAANKPLSRGGEFVREEDGTILTFTAVILVILMVVAGMGVDIMRFETTRTELQQTLDRSTLAAASLTQELDSEDVVRDYFDKAGLGDKLTSVVVTNGLNFRNVRAEAEADTNPIFMDLLDSSSEMQLMAKGLSIAEQRITNVEIMLVLDVSGSMAGAKLSNLKTSASEFVETVLEADGEGRISIGIVPYNGQVNLPQYMQSMYNMSEDHGVSNVNCADLPSSVYSGLGLSTSTALPVTGHVDTFSSTYGVSSYVSETNSDYATPRAENRWCLQQANTQVRAPTNNIAQLQGAINALTAGGATSINAGMKWGMALMDPGSRPVISGAVAAGQTPATFAGRPFNYNDDESMKVVVLMTDGEHFPEERLNDGYRSGISPIWRATDGKYSIFHNRANTNNDFWVPHQNTWRSTPYQSGSTAATQQTWPQVWQRQRMTWVAWQMYARAFGSTSAYWNAMNMFRTKTEVPAMNAQLQTVCDRARDNNVIVYGIAFEAPPAGTDQIEACSSTPGHFFDADGLEIQSAFRAIASNISQLRLTQ